MRKATRGQGVIEYAGGLVIAATLVSFVLAIGPTQMGGTMLNIVNGISAYLSAQAQALSQ